MIFTYKFLTIFFYPLIVVIIYVRKILGKEDYKRYKEKIFLSSIKTDRDPNKKLIWFHAASIGEIQSVSDLIEEYNKKKIEVLITTVTKTAANLVEEKLANKKGIYHRYFPIDVNFVLKKFLNQWSPDLIIFVDSEIWPNLMMQIKQKKISSIIVNARITKNTFNKWMLAPYFAKEIFSIFDLCLAANQETFQFLKDLNAQNIKYFGNLKLSNKINFTDIKSENDKILLNKKFWCAVSTHQGEDIFFLNTHSFLKNKNKNILTIIIPRHVNRCFEIKKLCEEKDFNCQILNRGEIIDIAKEIIIVNSFGNLVNYLKYAKSVFIGKSILKKFKKIGGQNPIEAAKLGCRIYHGPYTYNFKDIFNQLKTLNISQEVSNEEELSQKLLKDLQNSKSDNSKSIATINDLGEKIFSESLKEINTFL